MHKHLVLQTVCLTYLDELKQMVEAGVHTTVGSQTHQVQLLIVLLSVGVSSLHLRILHDGAVLAGTVDLH